MTEERFWTNTSGRVAHIGLKRVRPGETRLVDARLIPGADAERRETAREPGRDALDVLLAQPVTLIRRELAALTDAELAELERRETLEKNRQGLLTALLAERMHRSAARADADEAAGRPA